MKSKTPPVSLPRTLSSYAVDARKVSNGVITPLDAFDDSLPPKNLVIPFNLDAEFVDNLARIGPLDSSTIEGRFGVTTQIRGIAESNGTIFSCPDQARLAELTARHLRHPVVSHPCIVVDWLQSRGVDCQVVADSSVYGKTRKSCRLQVFAHFALADVAFLAGTAEFLETIVTLFQSQRLVMGRRLIARASGHLQAKSGIVGLSPWVIQFGDIQYRLTLEIIDTSGLHGIANYATLAGNTGVILEDKKRISREGVNADITRMDEIYFEKPTDYDAYALGDLYVSDIVHANEKLFGHIWRALGIEHRRVPPRLTIGGTVADMLRAKMAESLDANPDENPDEFIDRTTGNHNATYLARFAREKNPLALLSKVDGGRCRNGKPILTNMSGALCDIDIAGAYASAMSAIPLIFGRVRNVSYGNSRDNLAQLDNCPTLAEWLRRHEHQLIDRTWYARISTREAFSFETDLIPSWIAFRVAQQKSDSEVSGLDILTDPASGEIRYFGREIYSGTLTSDLLDVARNTMSSTQYKEWSEKLVVRAALYVDKNDWLSIDDYRQGFKHGELSDHAWSSLTLGELISDIARANRKHVQTTIGKKTPLDELYKLVSNTTYGVSVSRHFATSSVISGSNVTGTVRAFMYLAEKGLNLVGSITDGQLFDLNRVLHGRNRRISNLAINTRAYRWNKREMNQIATTSLSPLDGKYIDARIIDNEVELVITRHDGTSETVRGYGAKQWIDEKAYNHLIGLWPNCKLLSDTFAVVDSLNTDGSVKYRNQAGLFRFETKDILSRASFHGSANYAHYPVNPQAKATYKMRSFEANREHSAFTVDNQGELIYLDTYANQPPANILLDAIDQNPARVPILPPFTKTRILKPGIYSPKPVEGRKTVSRYHDGRVIVMPGDSVYVIGRPRLFSLAQYTFQTRSQYESWKRATNSLLNRHGLSFEIWFTNPDGVTADYHLMVDQIDEAIIDGVSNPIAYFDTRYGRRLDPSIIAYHTAKKKMSQHLNGRLLDGDEFDFETVSNDDRVEFDGGFSGEEYS